MQLGLVETRPVAEDARVLAEALAVVRGDDQPGSLEDAAPVELVEQLAELLVEVGDAIVVGVDAQRQVLRAECRALSRSPQCSISSRWRLSSAATPKRWIRPGGS